MVYFASSRWISEYIRKRGWPHAPVFRRRFNVASFKDAKCAICGLGFFELRLNGEKVGDDLMTPCITRYDVRSEYLVYDVAQYLHKGENVAEVVLGNGMFNQITNDIFRSERTIWKSDPKFILDLQLDGASALVSDSKWLVAHGPIVSNSIRTGEKYDARNELAEWKAGEEPEAAIWNRVYVTNSPGGALSLAEEPPCRVVQELNPVASWRTDDGAVIYDFGANIAGNCEISALGPAGGTITLIHGEKLDDARNLDNSHIGMYTLDKAFQTDVYTFGDKPCKWHPTFGYHGFQYVKAILSEGVSLNSIKARFIRSAFPVIAQVATSNETINRLLENNLRSFEANFVNIPTDCPHREKMGWTGDAQLAAELGLWYYDSKENYRAWLHSMRDCQRQDGQIPGMVPYCDHWQFGPCWDGALIILPYQIWRFTGDETPVRENYAAGKRLMQYFASLAEDDIIDFGPGDWDHVEQERAIKGVVDATAYYCVCARNMAQMALVVEEFDDVEHWSALAERIKAAFQKRFCRPDGHCAEDQSTALALALTLDLAPAEERDAMAQRLNKRMLDINCHADFGITGAKAVPRALAENGYFDTALAIFTQKEYPGWGWWLEQGATSFWETWKGHQSRNHIMFGDMGAWLWEFAGGISPLKPAFREFAVRPPKTSLLESFSGKHETPFGTLEWSWKKNSGTLIVPPCCIAHCTLPNGENSDLHEGAHSLYW